MTELELIADSIERATKEVFETMLGSEASLIGGTVAAEPEAGVVSVVGLTGNWSGTGAVSCTPAGARLIAERMLLLESQQDASIDDDVLDAVAELTNMIIGNIKNILSESFGEMAISIPTVVYGRNFRFKNLPGMTERVSHFHWEDQQIDVKVCLAPTLKAGNSCDRLGVPALTVG